MASARLISSNYAHPWTPERRARQAGDLGTQAGSSGCHSALILARRDGRELAVAVDPRRLLDQMEAP